MDRRTALGMLSGAIGLAATSTAADDRDRAVQSNATNSRVRKIATEEAFIIPEIAAVVRDVVRQGGPNLDLKLLRLIYDAPPGQPACRYLHAASGGAAPSSIRIVAGCAASCTMTASTCRRVDPVTTARISVPAGSARVSPFRTAKPRPGVS